MGSLLTPGLAPAGLTAFAQAAEVLPRIWAVTQKPLNHWDEPGGEDWELADVDQDGVVAGDGDLDAFTDQLANVQD